MSLNRRSMFGVMAATPLAGAELAKAAAASMEAPYPPNMGGLNIYSDGAGSGNVARSMMDPEDAIRKAFNLGIIKREQLLELLKQMSIGPGNVSIYNLDADLQAAKSFSGVARVRMQRERNQEREITRFLAKPKSFWDFGRELVAKGLVTEATP